MVAGLLRFKASSWPVGPRTAPARRSPGAQASVVVAEHHPGGGARVGHPHPPHSHAASRFSVVDDGR